MDSNRCSENMRRIKSKDTSIELLLRKRLWQEGIRYRKNYSCLPGKPDIAITKYKIAIFCDGEFFHGKDWNTLKQRLSKGQNSKYWVDKIERNIGVVRVENLYFRRYNHADVVAKLLVAFKCCRLSFVGGEAVGRHGCVVG